MIVKEIPIEDILIPQSFIDEEHKQYAAWYLESEYYKEKLGCSKEVVLQCKRIDKETEDFWQKLQDDIEKTLQAQFSYES